MMFASIVTPFMESKIELMIKGYYLVALLQLTMMED
jgi:hypothetical protein